MSYLQFYMKILLKGSPAFIMLEESKTGTEDTTDIETGTLGIHPGD